MDGAITIRYPSGIRLEWLRDVGNIPQHAAGLPAVRVSFLLYQKSASAAAPTDILITTNTKDGRRMYKNAKSMGFRRVIQYIPGGTNSAQRKIINNWGDPLVLSAEIVVKSHEFLAECVKLILYPAATDINYIDTSRCQQGCVGRHRGHSCTDRDGDVIMINLSSV